MSDERVCHHGGLRRQCEACDLAERLAIAVHLLGSITNDMSAWDERMECQCCGNRYRQGHEPDCTWLAAHAFVESEASPSRAPERPSGRV